VGFFLAANYVVGDLCRGYADALGAEFSFILFLGCDNNNALGYMASGPNIQSPCMEDTQNKRNTKSSIRERR